MSDTHIHMRLPLEVGICCTSLDTLLPFYTELLGLRLVSRIRVAATGAASTGLSHGGYEVARLQTSWGERIKLLQPDTPPEALPEPRPILARRNTSYLTFIVDDLAGLVTRLRALGLAFDSQPACMEVRPGTWLAFFRDPEGNVLELVEYDEPGQYRPDVTSPISQ